MTAAPRVLIVGAGPTGLVLACELARRGVPFRLVDQAAEPFAGSRGKGLSPRTLEIFEDLGLLGGILAAGGPFPVFRAYRGHALLWERTLQALGGFATLRPGPDRPYVDYWMVPQSTTDRLLRERLAALGGEVERATALVGLRQDEDGVTATLRRAAGSEEARVDWVVGADGGRSATRKLAGIGFLGETRAAERSVIADVGADGVDRAFWHMWVDPADPGRRVALCPLPGTDYFQLAAPLDASAFTPDLAALQRLFDARAGRGDVRLRDLRWASVHTVNVRLAERFRAGRVLLAGDAAHVHSPAGGQGLNTSIQDADNLGWKLAGACRGAPGALLDSYEGERLPTAAAVLGLTSALQARGFGGGSAEPAREDIYQLALGYRGGPLSLDARPEPGAVTAGDRAPDATCRDATGRAVRLFDRFRGPHHTVLAFGAEAPAGRAGVAAISIAPANTAPAPGTLLDADEQVRRAYEVSPGTFIVVRPDGYIGLMTHTAADIGGYLDRMT